MEEKVTILNCSFKFESVAYSHYWPLLVRILKKVSELPQGLRVVLPSTYVTLDKTLKPNVLYYHVTRREPKVDEK